MTQTAAIAKALLSGQTLSIMNGFQLFSCTNLPREISRSIEQKFNVVVSRMKVDFTSKYGQSGFYFQYRLNPQIEGNSEGIKRIVEYLIKEGAVEQTGNRIERFPTEFNKVQNPNQHQEIKQSVQANLFQ